MSDYYCDICDKTIKIKSKRKHLKSQHHQTLTNTIISRYHIPNPNFLDIENILIKYVNDYEKNFVLYLIICKCKLIFNDLTYKFKFKRMYNIQRYYSLRP